MKKTLLVFFLISFVNFAFSRTHVVKAINYKFVPHELSIERGDTVVWENTSTEAHTSTSGKNCKGDGSWDSGMINPKSRFQYVFSKTGTFNYFCTPHCADSMNGKILVGAGGRMGSNLSGSEMVVPAAFKPEPKPETVQNNTLAPCRHVVLMENYKFEPAELKINPGDTVVWVNKAMTVHTSTSGTSCIADGKWDSGNIPAGQSFSRVFTEIGVTDYFCIPHCSMNMTGRVITGNAAAPAPEPERNPSASFRSSDIINNQSVTTIPAGYLEFKIYHRFDDLAGSVGSYHNLYGLDNIRDYRIGFAYGITDRFMAGFGRNKGDQFQAPYQAVSELYDGYLKYRLLKQSNEPGGKAPFSLALFANTVLTTMKSQTNNVFSEAYFPRFSDRFSHCFQILAAYNFRNKLSLQVMPTYLKRNWVNPWTTDKDEINLFSIGGAARWNLTKHFSVISEYFYTFSDYRKRHKDVFSNPLSAGIEIYTGRHIFHLNLSNSTGLIPNTFIPYTTSSWDKGQFRFGFSITRLFRIAKKHSAEKK